MKTKQQNGKEVYANRWLDNIYPNDIDERFDIDMFLMNYMDWKPVSESDQKELDEAVAWAKHRILELTINDPEKRGIREFCDVTPLNQLVKIDDIRGRDEATIRDDVYEQMVKVHYHQ